MELLVKGARIVDWSSDFIGDVYVKDGVITEIGKDIKEQCDVINGEGAILLPALIDLHAHFREPGYTYKEDIYTGSMAAVRGGYTAVNLMANTKPVCSDMNTIEQVLKRGKEVSFIDIHQCSSITNNFNGTDISHLDKLHPSVRIISEDGKDVMDSKIMMKAMEKAREKNLLVMCHCEDMNMNSDDSRLAENTMTWRNVTLGGFTGCKTHIAHVSTKEAMEYIIDGKRKGYRLTCEVTPHHLALTSDNGYLVNPPLREKEDIAYLIKCIKEGYIDAISTDHAPHSIEDKRNGAVGISGIETAFPICYTKLVREGYISMNKLSELMSKNPSEIAGFNKGSISIGKDADMILVDTKKSWKISSDEFKSKGKNTPFEGQEVWGKVIMTIKSGKVVYADDKNSYEN